MVDAWKNGADVVPLQFERLRRSGNSTGERQDLCQRLPPSDPEPCQRTRLCAV